MKLKGRILRLEEEGSRMFSNREDGSNRKSPPACPWQRPRSLERAPFKPFISQPPFVESWQESAPSDPDFQVGGVTKMTAVAICIKS